MEKEYLFNKKVKCAVCQEMFEAKTVRTARIRRQQPDFDLRPRFQDIDTIKYDVYSCPHCGYTALSRYFDPLTKGQISQVLENICMHFTPPEGPEPEVYDYDYAIARYEQALKCSNIKKAKVSEIAYTCLKLSWIDRAYGEGLPESEVAGAKQKEEDYYKKAYEGFQKALTTEDFPICGMDSLTMDYLLACIACHFKEYSFASKAVSNILGSQVADRRMKDKALDLKDIIVSAIKKEAEKKNA